MAALSTPPTCGPNGKGPRKSILSRDKLAWAGVALDEPIFPKGILHGYQAQERNDLEGCCNQSVKDSVQSEFVKGDEERGRFGAYAEGQEEVTASQ